MCGGGVSGFSMCGGGRGCVLTSFCVCVCVVEAYGGGGGEWVKCLCVFAQCVCM